MSRPLVGLGRAVGLEFQRLGRSRVEKVSFPAYWWAWDGSATGGNIRLVKAIRPTATVASKMHTKFHDAPPTGALVVNAEPMGAPLTVVGRAISFTYDAEKLDSNKSDARYCHHFGAFTHDDRPPFPEHYWPDVVVDRSGQLMLKRKPGNAFKLEDWVIG